MSVTLPSGLPEAVGSDEDIARFVFSSNGYNSNGVKWVAFSPNPANGETSVFRKSEAIAETFWVTAKAIAEERGASLYGAARLKAGSIVECGLSVESSEPPPAHANIVGWPVLKSDLKMQKAARMELAKVLAAASVFIKAPG